jgi:hypothetical protein
MLVIGVTGLAGSGKTEVAKHLRDKYGFARIRFTDPLKKMMRALGLTTRHVDGDLKEKPCALLDGQTPRWAMQTIGTEWGRKLISENIWVKAWEKTARKALKKGTSVVADDVRFQNEVDAIYALGGVMIRVDRPGHVVAAAHVKAKWWEVWHRFGSKQHASEQYVIDYAGGDVYEMTNDGSLDDLRERIDGVIYGLAHNTTTALTIHKHTKSRR